MSGLGLVLSIAKDALAAQRYGMDVTGHNIANVNTPGYSRQSPIYEAKEPAPYGGVLLGRGVDITQIVRVSDQFIENRLMQQKSSMLSLEQMENYMQVLEGLFNENSETSISAMLADFWNLWHDIANNPSGASERIALYEHSILLSEQFKNLDAELTQLETDLTNAVSAGIDEINLITNEIAQLNGQIVGMETSNIANDLRDKRNTLVSELSEYIYVKSFEQSDGSLSVITAKGCILVHTNSSYDLELGGDNGDRVKWQASGDATVDITDYITDGKLGGWLDMRDEIIAKYKLDLDAVAKEFIWAVNQQHSQGVGLQLFSSEVTGTYGTGSSGLLSTLTYGNRIDYTKDFKVWIDDGSAPTDVTVDMGISTASVEDWGNDFDTGGTYTIVVTQGGTISDSDGATKIKWKLDSGAFSAPVDVSAAGIVSINGNDALKFVSTGTLVAGNTITFNTKADLNADPLVLTIPSGTANSVSDTYTFTVTRGGTIDTDAPVIAWSNSVTSGTITITESDDYTVDGMTLSFASGTLVVDETFTITIDSDGTPTATLPSDWHWTLESFKGQFNDNVEAVFGSKVVEASVTSDNALKLSPDTGCSFGFCDDAHDDCGLLATQGINTFFDGSSAGSIGLNSKIANKDYIAAAQIDGDTGDFGSGDNTNALAITDLQYTSSNIAQWTCNRGSAKNSANMTATMEGYYHSTVGSIGIKSASISRSKAFNEVMFNKLGEIRDGISAVSLDEEMTNLIKFQRAYAAAAKLISISDEMLNTLLSVK